MGGVTGGWVSVVETAKVAAHEALACFDAIVAGKSGGGKETWGGEWRRYLEINGSEKPKTPQDTQTRKEQDFVNKL